MTTEYSNGILKATYPLSFNTTSTSVSSGTCSISTPTLSSLNGLFTQNTFFVADGTGTIALPNGTLTNVLRVTSTESMVINANPYTFNYIKLSYDYYASGIKQAVFSIVSHTITGTYLSQPFSLPNQVYVKRAMTIPSSTLTSIKQENELKLNFSILPNPSNNEVRVAAKNDFFGLIDQMKIYDLSGKLVNEYQFINDNMLLDVSNYNNGVYFVKFYDRNNTIIETQKLIINH